MAVSGFHTFLKVKFANKDIDSLNLSNMLNQKSVKNKIPPYFQYKESPCISYSYTRSVASKILNYKGSLELINFHSLSQNPTLRSCCDSEFLYAPCGRIVTGDLSIARNQRLRDILRNGQKYREPVSFSWHQNFNISMDACQEYARRWAKQKRSTEGCSKLKSPETRQVQERLLSTLVHVQVPKWDWARCPEE